MDEEKDFKKRAKRLRLKYSKWKPYYAVLFFVGSITIVFEIYIFRKTFISIYLPLAIIFVVGGIATIINRTHFNLSINSSGWIWPIIQNVVSWGFITCYLFMAGNYYFANNASSIKEFEIESKDSMYHRGGRKPYVFIDYQGSPKQLIFSFEDSQKVKSATKIILYIRKGLFGFDVLDHYNLK